MCVTLPAKVLKRASDGNWTVRTIRGIVCDVVSAVDSVESGEYVSIFAGTIMEKLSKEEFEERSQLWRQITHALVTEDLGLTNTTRRKRKRE